MAIERLNGGFGTIVSTSERFTVSGNDAMQGRRRGRSIIDEVREELRREERPYAIPETPALAGNETWQGRHAVSLANGEVSTATDEPIPPIQVEITPIPTPVSAQ